MNTLLILNAGLLQNSNSWKKRKLHKKRWRCKNLRRRIGKIRGAGPPGKDIVSQAGRKGPPNDHSSGKKAPLVVAIILTKITVMTKVDRMKSHNGTTERGTMSEMPETPETPETPEMSEMPEMSEKPEKPEMAEITLMIEIDTIGRIIAAIGTMIIEVIAITERGIVTMTTDHHLTIERAAMRKMGAMKIGENVATNTMTGMIEIGALNVIGTMTTEVTVTMITDRVITGVRGLLHPIMALLIMEASPVFKVPVLASSTTEVVHLQ
jgi:hypothetical protein